MTSYKEELFERTGIQEYDSCYAVVTGTNSHGSYISITDSKTPLQSFVYGGYRIGDRLLVTVRLNEKRRRMICKVDSVVSYAFDVIERGSVFKDAA